MYVVNATCVRFRGESMTQFPRPSVCGTFHVTDEGERTHEREFEWVLPFHEPGLAPVGDGSGAYHIQLNGDQAYDMRFDRTFGFYGGFAAVISGDMWYHIDVNGKKAYPRSWVWCGNFQQGRCSVRGEHGLYYHIRPDGSVLRGGPHSYAGDFREGYAVVRGADGLCRHIDREGEPLNAREYLDLDVFHKGYARARDTRGWHHIDHLGRDISSGARYLELEPFYNGQALARSITGEYLVIDECGKTQAKPVRSDLDVSLDFQNIAVAYWRPMAIRLGILLGLTGEDAQIESKPEERSVVEHAWMEMGLLDSDAILTERGLKLRKGEVWRDRFLYWTGPQFAAWAEGEARLSKPELRTDFFAEGSLDPETSSLIQRVLDSYASEDWDGIGDLLCISPDETVVDLGGGKGALLLQIGDAARHRILVERPEVIDMLALPDVEAIAADIFVDELPHGDVYLLSRILHDWNDKKCLALLNRIPKAGRLIVIDRVVEQGNHGLLSLNMLLLTGGRERTQDDWIELFMSSGWQIFERNVWSGHAIMELRRRTE